MTRIFMEEFELDVSQQISNQITYAIDDLQNMDSKSTSFTKTIVLQGTANNNRLFGNIFEFANSNYTADGLNVNYNFNASKSANARIEVDGLIVMKGVLRLLQIVIDGDNIDYEVALFGELGGFFSKLTARKLSDLDFSEYNHQYNVTNIANSWNNANGGSGYYYPLIDYGNTSPINNPAFAKKSFYFTAFRPAFFVREYIDKIITGAGYTWESNFFNTDFFKRLIIPNNQVRLSSKKTTIFTGKPTGILGLSSIDEKKITFTNVIGGDFTTSDNKTWQYNGAQNFSGTINFKGTGYWYLAFTGKLYGFRQARFALYKNNTFVTYDNVGTQTSIIGGTAKNGLAYRVNFSFDVQFLQLGQFNLQTNDTFSIRLEQWSGTDSINVSLSGSELSLNGAPTFTPAEYNDNLIVSETLPKGVLQKDFFSSILKMFNLMVTEDKYTEKKLLIEPYVDFYNTDRTTFIDWSDKIDRSQVIKIKPMSEINARYYDIKFKSDSDNYNEQYRKKYTTGYGDFRYNNELEFAKDTSTTEVIFSASPLIGYTNNDKIFPAIYKLNNNTEEMIEHNIRIMQAKKISGRTSWNIYSKTNSVLASYTTYGYAGHLDDPNTPYNDLNFGAPAEIFFNLQNLILFRNLFNMFYSSYFAEITDKDSRLVTAKMKFTPKDIFNLDFGKLIYNDGVLYRLIKIKDYSDNELSEVELLRVNYLQYDVPNYEAYTLGQPLFGGYIVYLDATGEHGLIAPDYDELLAEGNFFQYNWINAIAYCNNLVLNSYSDWRMGTLTEMRLIDVNQIYIPNFINVGFWTSTLFNFTNAYWIDMDSTGNNINNQDINNVNLFAYPIKSF